MGVNHGRTDALVAEQLADLLDGHTALESDRGGGVPEHMGRHRLVDAEGRSPVDLPNDLLNSGL